MGEQQDSKLVKRYRCDDGYLNGLLLSLRMTPLYRSTTDGDNLNVWYAESAEIVEESECGHVKWAEVTFRPSCILTGAELHDHIKRHQRD